MSEIAQYPGSQETSPRSTILAAKVSSMTSAIPLIINESNIAAQEALLSQGKIAPSQNVHKHSSNETLKPTSEPKVIESSDLNAASSFDYEAPPTPISHDYSSYLHYANPTPSQQAMSGYYVYPPQTHLIPDPESPGGNRLIGTYDVGPFFQPHAGAAFHPTNASPGALLRVGRPSTALLASPTKGSSSVAAVATPTSPLFSRGSLGTARNDEMTAVHQGPPALPYMTSPQLAPALYQMYPSTGITSNSSDDGTWAGQNSDTRNSYQQSNLGMPMHYGVPLSRATSVGRSYSVDESMLPPSMFDDPTYSPYPGSNISHSSTSGFAPQMAWAYSTDMYASPTSSLQPRPTVQLGMIPNSPNMRQGPAHGQNYTINSPGHPIQTTALNKGPDGANLFIFHIPNHYTNLDMFHLFLPFGNLLSVRIMVERDTGRSRGFGFVSYDSAESAAMAIKELNGYPIGNKRLKVQHKQIRRNDVQDDEEGFSSSVNFQSDPSLPPAVPSQSDWYSSGNLEDEDGILDDDDDEIDINTRPKAEIPDQSALATLGQLKNSLPEIPGHPDESQE